MTMHIHFIGFGNLAKAIARGLVKLKKYSLSTSAPSLAVGVNSDGIHTHFDNTYYLQQAEVIILAVKPVNMDKVITEIAPYLSKQCLLISVAAGLSLNWYNKRLPNHPIIRTMPNTPAAIGLSATPMIANEFVSDQHKEIADNIFSTVGMTEWIFLEEEMDAFTALSGSGPAYVFLYIEAMISAGIALGLQEDIARTFTLQTLTGALQLAKESDLSIEELREKVTSPGGTTAAALGILNPSLKSLMLDAMTAAKQRSQELGQAL